MYKEHNHVCKSIKELNFAVLTISSTRNKGTDECGKLIKEIIERNAFRVVFYGIVKDNVSEIKRVVRKLLRMKKLNAIVTTGGTGISRKDVTIEAIHDMIEKKIEGFGELFRYLSYKEIGTATILSRSFGGVANKKIVFCIPGAKNAVKLAMEKIIIPEVGHMIYELTKE